VAGLLSPALLLALALGGNACRSTPPKKPAAPVDENDPTVYDTHLLDPDKPVPIGKFLAELDNSMRAWTRLTITASSKEERTKASKLQLDLMRRAQPRQKELIAELEAGPPRNRAIAASALGFTRGDEVLSPLLAALHDSDADVQQNALLGLALLQSPATPLAPLSEIVASDPVPHTRANAAYAIRSALEAGATPDSNVLTTLRLALADTEKLVVVQCALALGLAHDSESIDHLADLLRDDTPLVSLSASQALVLIGAGDPQVKGKAARALVAGYANGNSRQRDDTLRGLIALSGQDLGTEVRAWKEWAQRLP
jgi:HEAT repeat protein